MKNLIIAKVPKELKISILNPNIILEDNSSYHIYLNKKDILTYLPGILKEDLKLTIQALLRNNPKTIINEIWYSEQGKALRIYANKKLKIETQINEFFVVTARGLSEWFYEESERVENEMLSDFTFIESERETKLEDYISLYDVFNIQKTIVEKFKTIKELEEICITKLENDYAYYIFDLEFDYTQFLLNRTKAIKITILSPLGKGFVFFIEKNKIPDKVDCFGVLRIELKGIKEELLEIFDILENYKRIFNMPNDFLVPIRNYDGQIIINKEKILLMNETFLKLEISMDGNVTCSSDNYKEFLFLSKNYNDVMKNTYLEKRDIPFCNEQSYSFINKYSDKKKTKSLYKK